MQQPITPTQAVRLLQHTAPGLADLTSYAADGTGTAGTAILLTADGLAVTNYHVIADSLTLTALDLSDAQQYQASVVAADRAADIALIALHGAAGLPTAQLGDSHLLALGEPVASIGNSYGLGGATINTGAITALGETIPSTTDSTRRLSGMIEVNDGLAPGQSGGPLVERYGRVIGINTAFAHAPGTETPSGQGWAMPIDTAMRIVHALLSHQRHAHSPRDNSGHRGTAHHHRHTAKVWQEGLSPSYSPLVGAHSRRASPSGLNPRAANTSTRSSIPTRGGSWRAQPLPRAGHSPAEAGPLPAPPGHSSSSSVVARRFTS